MWELCFNEIPKQGCESKWRKIEKDNESVKNIFWFHNKSPFWTPSQESNFMWEKKVRGGVTKGSEVPTSHLCGWHTPASQVAALTAVWSDSFRLSNLQHSTMKMCSYSFWRGAQWPQGRGSTRDQFWRTQRCGLALWVALLPQWTEELLITLWVSTYFDTTENPLFPSLGIYYQCWMPL